MDISVDKKENLIALIKIKVNEDDYQPKVSQKIKDYSKKANIKGFRPGKVPVGMIKKLYGTSFIVDEVNQILSTELNKLLRESETQFLGEPMPDEEKMKGIQWQDQKDFEFDYKIGYTEEFEIPVNKKTKIDLNRIKIDNKLINETIDNLKKQFGELKNTEIVEEDDTVYGPITSKDSEINQEISIELKDLSKSYKKKFIGAKLDSEIELDVQKAFEEEGYFGRISNLSEEEIKAAKSKFSFKIKGINHTIPAEINQDLFDKTFGKDAVKSEEDFKKKIEETIRKNYSKEEEQYFDYKLRELIVEKTKIDLPDDFLKEWLTNTNENLTPELLETEYQNYAKELKWSLIRNKLAKDNDIKVEHADVMAEAKDMILQQFGGASIAEQLGDQLNTFADNYLKGENGENYMKVFNQVMSIKVYNHLKENITVKEKEIPVEEFRKLS